MPKILIKNGRIWDGERFYNSDVLLENAVVSKIAENITEKADFCFDASDKIVSTGLVDLHVHFEGISTKRFGVEPHLSSFPFGVTAANNAGAINGDKVFSDSLKVKNVVFVNCGVKNNHAYFDGTKKALERYGDKALGIKFCFDTTDANIVDITPLQEICDFARSNNLKVMVHCTNSPTSMAEIVNTLSKGDILTHVFHGGKNACTENDFEAFKIAREKGVVLDSGFAGHVHTDFANLRASVENGFLPDTISTDITCWSAYMRGGKYGMTMCMSIARTAGISEECIFRATTSTPAKILGKVNEWGYLKEGRCADISVFDYTDEGFDLTDNAGNNIKNKLGYRCVFTVVDGKIVYRY